MYLIDFQLEVVNGFVAVTMSVGSKNTEKGIKQKFVILKIVNMVAYPRK